jgi:transcriptional regulator with XRE-family HTH domain
VKTIRALRQERGWSQYDLARKIGVHPQAVYLWESGRRTPRVPQLRKMGQLFERCSDDIDLEVPLVAADDRDQQHLEFNRAPDSDSVEKRNGRDVR